MRSLILCPVHASQAVARSAADHLHRAAEADRDRVAEEVYARVDAGHHSPLTEVDSMVLAVADLKDATGYLLDALAGPR